MKTADRYEWYSLEGYCNLPLLSNGWSQGTTVTRAPLWHRQRIWLFLMPQSSATILTLPSGLNTLGSCHTHTPSGAEQRRVWESSEVYEEDILKTHWQTTHHKMQCFPSSFTAVANKAQNSSLVNTCIWCTYIHTYILLCVCKFVSRFIFMFLLSLFVHPPPPIVYATQPRQIPCMWPFLVLSNKPKSQILIHELKPTLPPTAPCHFLPDQTHADTVPSWTPL